jgi:exodeoxyribonuclease VII small subunit
VSEPPDNPALRRRQPEQQHAPGQESAEPAPPEAEQSSPCQPEQQHAPGQESAKPAPPEAEQSSLEQSYPAAVAELEGILVDLEQDDVDVDVLAPKVRRAAELIRFCRAHIGAARLDVEQIVADLEDLDPADPESRPR